MTDLLTAASVGHAHVAETAARQIGWRICTAPRPSSVLGVVRTDDVLRIILGEVAEATDSATSAARVLEFAAGMTADRRPLQEVADVLAGSRSMSGHRPPASSSITLIDLHPDGSADIACRCSPSLMYARAGQPIQLLPPTPNPSAGGIRLVEGDRLLAYTPSFLESQPPQLLVDLPAAAAAESDACALWNWVSSTAAAAEQPAPTPDLVIITRTSEAGAQ